MKLNFILQNRAPTVTYNFFLDIEWSLYLGNQKKIQLQSQINSIPNHQLKNNITKIEWFWLGMFFYK